MFLLKAFHHSKYSSIETDWPDSLRKNMKNLKKITCITFRCTLLTMLLIKNLKNLNITRLKIKMQNMDIKEASLLYCNISPKCSHRKKLHKLCLKSKKLSIKPFVPYNPIWLIFIEAASQKKKIQKCALKYWGKKFNYCIIIKAFSKKKNKIIK